MSCIIGPEQLGKSVGTHDVGRGGDGWGEPVADQDVRCPAGPHSLRPTPADPRAPRASPVTVTHFRPFPMPIRRVEPVYLTPGGPQRAVGATESIQLSRISPHRQATPLTRRKRGAFA